MIMVKIVDIIFARTPFGLQNWPCPNTDLGRVGTLRTRYLTHG